MNKLLFNIILLIMCLNGMIGVGQINGPHTKDTLFLNYEPNYVVDGDQTAINSDKYLTVFYDSISKHNPFNGFLEIKKATVFLLIDSKIEGIDPSTLIEQDSMYLVGEYNSIISIGKLRRKLTEKYQLVFIRDNQLIIPKEVRYKQFKSSGNGNLFSKKPIHRDTLVLSLHDDSLEDSDHASLGELFLRNYGNNGQLSFIPTEEAINLNKEPVNLMCWLQDRQKDQSLPPYKDATSAFEVLNDYLVFMYDAENDNYRLFNVRITSL
ncbi:hypothetical protein [Zeaxanthinibacter enoshimensis]|uniref:Uncharacterized protein n=1 Tax=Zeaxanthinibacter enoshimensis TaxID=392009 RepID=A0A4R6TGV6_9FLAO|nr:hypothetical protein [Zeaxanthinibacter enoshimensis]TDQ29083.1 hypothetical protein CLV82_2533 [Zeaxanthinibacter enoshimensis]